MAVQQVWRVPLVAVLAASAVVAVPPPGALAEGAARAGLPRSQVAAPGGHPADPDPDPDPDPGPRAEVGGVGGAVPPVPGPVLAVFAPPAGPYGAGHRGVDLAARPGEPVRAVLVGTVAFAGQVAGRGWVTLDHGGGLRTTYGVLQRWSVAVGQEVVAGEVVGLLAGDADHLDWGAARDGAYIDPLALLERGPSGRLAVHLVDPERLRTTPPPPIGPPSHSPAGSGASREAGRQSLLSWPVDGRLTSRFGPRTHPLTGERRLHAGVDIAAAAGTPVTAAAAGVVTEAGARGGYGLLVRIDHGDGLASVYAHASVLAVRAGDRVERGQFLARVGSSGASTGPHLHLEVRVDGVPRDPLDFLPP